MHQALAAALDEVARRDRGDPARRARGEARPTRPRWPMIVLRTPKGWTGPEGGRRPAGRGHVALAPGAAGRGRATNPEHLPQLEAVAAQLPAGGAVRRGRRACVAELAALAPAGERRMSANPHANGGAAAARPRAARLPRLRGRRRRARAGVDARPRACSAPGCATSIARNPRRTSGSSAPTRRRRTGSAPCSRPPTAPGTAEIDADGDDHLAPRRPRDGGALASTCARAGSRATCSPAGTASSTATRRSSTSSTRCSTSTRSG